MQPAIINIIYIGNVTLDWPFGSRSPKSDLYVPEWIMTDVKGNLCLISMVEYIS